MSRIRIEQLGITKAGTECIVNAANENLQAGGGVCGVIFQAAGYKQLQKACDDIGYCNTGSAVITPAYNLNAKYIIHAVGPVWYGGKKKEPQKLYGCYKASLNLAKDYGCHSIAFPLISAGIFGYPKDQAWRKALQACNDFIHDNPDYDMDILFMDLKTDARLRKALKQEITDAIVIIVAQRVSTILDADRIIVLDEGRVAGMGRHEELLRECPLYYEIAASQLSEEELQHVR